MDDIEKLYGRTDNLRENVKKVAERLESVKDSHVGLIVTVNNNAEQLRRAFAAIAELQRIVTDIQSQLATVATVINEGLKKIEGNNA